MKEGKESPSLLPPLDLREFQSQLVWANERAVEPQFMDARLAASRIVVAWLIQAGSVRISDARGDLQVAAGHWVFPARGDARQRFGAGSRILSVRFTWCNAGGEELIPRDRHQVVAADDCPELERRAKALVRAVRPWTHRGTLIVGREQVPLDANLEIEAAFQLWLAAYAGAMARVNVLPRVRRVEDARVRKALALIERHPLSKPFRVAELARACGLGVNRLGALFHAAVGKSPLACYESVRLERARELLTDSDYRVKEIAWELGFGSLQHFSNWFKGKTGQSPRQYRRV